MPHGARAAVVIAHPHPLQGGDVDNHVVRAVAVDLAARGLASLRFDFRHAKSRESVGDAALVADSEDDLLAAVANVRAALAPGAPIGLAGYSFGAAIAVRAAARAQAAAVGAIGLPAKGRLLDGIDPRGLAMPVLVMQGEYDEAGSPDDVRALGARLAVPFEVRPVPKASHGYFGEVAIVARILGGFLAKRLPGSLR